MTDRCEKCGRPIVARLYPDADDCSQDFDGSPDPTCRIISAAYRRGLREGVELARRHVHKTECDACLGKVGWDRVGCAYCVESVDWFAVDDELERRLK